ncbi:MAG TPA: hypothetical protein VFI49_13245 [Rudaea sp.]|nr:hypothetical protein [Rudaea sp.]
MKRHMLLAMGLLVVLASFAGSARADEVALVTGEHWTKSTEDQKKAYLIGIANMAQVEAAYQGSTPQDAQSLIPRMQKGLKGQTLDSVREGLNKWYAANPAKANQPVIETIWFEMVVPGLQTNK